MKNLNNIPNLIFGIFIILLVYIIIGYQYIEKIFNNYKKINN